VTPRAGRLGVIAGSGMGSLARTMSIRRTVAFADIDGVGPCGVDGHAGEVHDGAVDGREWVLVAGRRHCYEGEADAMHALVGWLAARGVTDLLVLSAAGALRPTLQPGDLVVVRAVVDRQNRRPPATRRPERLALDPGLTSAVERAACRACIPHHRGTVVCGIGPAYETRSEVTALQAADGDVATMSAAPEVAAAREFALRAAVVALVTNPCTGIGAAALSHADVLREGERSAGRLARLIRELVVNM